MSFKSMRDTPQGYGAGSVLDAAEQHMTSLLADLENNEVEHYACDEQRAVSFMIAGGGPSAEVTFLLRDGEPETAIFVYWDLNRATVPVPSWAVARLYEAFRTYGS